MEITEHYFGKPINEMDRVNIFIQLLLTSSRFESQEEIGKFIGYHNKSSFSQILKKEMTPNFRNAFLKAFPEFHNFRVGFCYKTYTDLSEQIKALQETLDELNIQLERYRKKQKKKK